MSVILVLLPIVIAVAGSIKVFEESKGSTNVISVSSKMKDEDLLRKALEQYGCKSVISENRLDYSLTDARVIFQRNSSGIFDAIFTGDINDELAIDFVNNIQSEYLRLVQEMVYKKLLKRASAKGMILESETIQKDNTILLTFSVK